MVEPIPRSMRMEAPAKVNLHLSVGPRRDDGYHDLLSIFQMIDLSDTVEVTIRPDRQFSVSVDMSSMGAIEGNTMQKAAILFAKATGIRQSVDIVCTKRIPLQAGLGGGSSDAATVLLLLNDLFGTPLHRHELCEIGATVGSDVPFFLGDSTVACVEGRGEILTPLFPRTDLNGMLILPCGHGISTREAFGRLDRARGQKGVVLQTEEKSRLVAMYAEPVDQWRFFNDFREVMGVLAPWYDMLDALVADEPGAFGTVSGSGSAYCIVSTEDEFRERFRTKMKNLGTNVTIFDIKSLHRVHSGVTVSL